MKSNTLLSKVSKKYVIFHQYPVQESILPSESLWPRQQLSWNGFSNPSGRTISTNQLPVVCVDTQGERVNTWWIPAPYQPVLGGAVNGLTCPRRTAAPLRPAQYRPTGNGRNPSRITAQICVGKPALIRLNGKMRRLRFPSRLFWPQLIWVVVIVVVVFLL